MAVLSRVSVLLTSGEISTERRRVLGDSAAGAPRNADVEALSAVVRGHGEIARPASAAATR